MVRRQHQLQHMKACSTDERSCTFTDAGVGVGQPNVHHVAVEVVVAGLVVHVEAQPVSLHAKLPLNCLQCAAIG